MRKKRRGCLSRLLTGCLLLCILVLGVRFGLTHFFPMSYSGLVTAEAEKNGVSPALLYALIKAESNFDPSAVSEKGAKGLMQLMDGTAAWCAEKAALPCTDLLNPEENIPLGAFYFGYLLQLYDGNETCAVAAYNAGHGRVDSWLADPRYSSDGKTLSEIPFPETEKYVKKVQFYKKIYEKRVEAL